MSGGAGHDTYVFHGGDVTTGETISDTVGESTFVVNGAVDLGKASITLDDTQAQHTIVLGQNATLTLGPAPAATMDVQAAPLVDIPHLEEVLLLKRAAQPEDARALWE